MTTDGQDVERGAAEEGAQSPLTETEVEASRRPPSQPYSDETREAEEAHGGSMAPGYVDPTGHQTEAGDQIAAEASGVDE